MDTETKNIHIKFAGPQLESGRIDIWDFSQSVSALNELLHLVAKEAETTKGKNLKLDLIALNKGSFDVNIAITVRDLTDYIPAIVPLLSDVRVISSVQQLIELVKELVDVKKFLQGEKAQGVQITHNEGAPQITIKGNTGKINVNVVTYNLLQSKKTNQKLHKLVQPLLKDGAEVESIEIEGDSIPKLTITKKEAPFLKKIFCVLKLQSLLI